MATVSVSQLAHKWFLNYRTTNYILTSYTRCHGVIFQCSYTLTAQPILYYGRTPFADCVPNFPEYLKSTVVLGNNAKPNNGLRSGTRLRKARTWFFILPVCTHTIVSISLRFDEIVQVLTTNIIRVDIRQRWPDRQFSSKGMIIGLRIKHWITLPVILPDFILISNAPNCIDNKTVIKFWLLIFQCRELDNGSYPLFLKASSGRQCVLASANHDHCWVPKTSQ